MPCVGGAPTLSSKRQGATTGLSTLRSTVVGVGITDGTNDVDDETIFHGSAEDNRTRCYLCDIYF